MNAKKTSLAVALTMAVGFGVAQQAVASVYAVSTTKIDNLQIVLSDDGGTTPGTGGFVRGFNFNLVNTAFLNGLGGATNAVCTGTITPTFGNNCIGGLNPGYVGIVTPGTRLDADAINGTGSVPVRTNNNFATFGPGTDQYSNADSVIYTAALTGDFAAGTSTQQIAESELQHGSSASSSAEITSTTGFTFTFTVVGANQLAISFNALGNYLAAVADPFGVNQNAQANTKFQMTLTNDAVPVGGPAAQFSPSGNTATDCVAATITCVASLDQFDLNTDVGVSTNPNSQGRSNTIANDDFSVIFGNLTDGDWTLTLTSVTSTVLSRTEVSVPAPGLLSLMGLGLVGLGVTRRRAVKHT